MEKFSLEVGLLVLKEEFPEYAKVYDEENGYYDEDISAYYDLKKAIESAKEYVINGVNNTYAVITYQGYFNEEIDDFDKSNLSNFSYEKENIIYFCKKNSLGKFIEVKLSETGEK